MLKALLNSAPVQTVIAALVAAHMSLCKATTRWTREGLEHAEPVWRSGRGVVGCVWHGRILMTIAVWPEHAQPASILISRSREGDIVSRVAQFQKVGVVRGSSRNAKKAKEKGGLSAFREMARRLEAGGCMAMTPDGPRGPRMRAGAGSVRLARAAGVPILPVGWSMSRAKVFGSWDRFMLPLPFGKGAIVYGAPIEIAADAGPEAVEAARALLEERLNDATSRADRLCRGEAIEPAPLAPERTA
ncbi:MAG: lysophospholipid acyltransferase family protein [Oceanicaulis sp.]